MIKRISILILVCAAIYTGVIIAEKHMKEKRAAETVSEKCGGHNKNETDHKEEAKHCEGEGKLKEQFIKIFKEENRDKPAIVIEKNSHSFLENQECNQ